MTSTVSLNRSKLKDSKVLTQQTNAFQNNTTQKEIYETNVIRYPNLKCEINV
jgi:hypothetical protein